MSIRQENPDDQVFCCFHTVPDSPCEQSLLLSFSFLRREKEALPESRQLFEAVTARTSGLVNLVFSRQTGFSSANIHLVIKPMVIIEPAVP